MIASTYSRTSVTKQMDTFWIDGKYDVSIGNRQQLLNVNLTLNLTTKHDTTN